MAKKITKSTSRKSTLRRKGSAGQPPDFMPKLTKPKVVKPPQLTVKNIVSFTSIEDKKRSKDVRVKSISVMQSPRSKLISSDTLIYRVVCNNPDNNHNHDVTVMLPDGEFKPSAKVILDCSCPRWVYNFEYAMAKRYGNAFIWRCNGQPPTTTNPSLSPSACVDKDTLIYTDQGPRPIKDLSVGDKVETVRGKYSKIIDITNNGRKESVTLETSRSQPTTVSLDHLMYAYSNGRLRFIPASQLEVGDKLVQRKPKVSNTIIQVDLNLDTSGIKSSINIPKELDEDLSFLLGFFSGDGSVRRDGIKAAQKRRDYICSVRDRIESVFGVRFAVKKSKSDLWHLRTKGLNRQRAVDISNIFRQLGLLDWNKQVTSTVPQCINVSDVECKRHFIDGYWTADGTFGSREKAHASCMSVSKDMCVGIQKLLLDLGIYSAVHCRGITGWGNLPQYDVRISSNSDLVNLAHVLSLKKKTVDRNLKNISSNRLLLDWKYMKKRFAKKVCQKIAKENYAKVITLADLTQILKSEDLLRGASSGKDGILRLLQRDYPQLLIKIINPNFTKGKKIWAVCPGSKKQFVRVLQSLLKPSRKRFPKGMILKNKYILSVYDRLQLDILRDKNRDWYLIPIESITPAGIREVYDMEVEDETHTYLAHGLVSHNCKHGIAAFRALNNQRKQGKLPTKPRKNSRKLSTVNG